MNQGINTARHPDYFKLRNMIKSAEKRTQLDSMYQTVERFALENEDDGEILLALMTTKLKEVDPYFNIPLDDHDIETYHHIRRCGGHHPNERTIIDNPLFNIRLQP